VATLLPRHALAPSEKAKNVPLPGFSMPSADLVPEAIAKATAGTGHAKFDISFGSHLHVEQEFDQRMN
jgi:hypothetical protein